MFVVLFTSVAARATTDTWESELMRTFVGLLIGLVLLAPLLSGCGPALTEEELGTLILDQSGLPRASVPYKLPLPESTYTSESESESEPMPAHSHP